MSLIGNVDTPASYVADYMQACVGMLGIPAGGFTADIEAFGATNGYDVEALYGAMLNSSIGRSIYAPGSSNATFAAKLVEKLGGGLLSDDAEAWALDWAETQLDNGMSRAALAMEAVESISVVDTVDENFGAVAQQFANRIEIANYYTFSSASPSSSVSTLTAVLSGVDNETDVSDPAAVLEENTDPGVSGDQTFTLTTGADNVGGTGNSYTGIIADTGVTAAAGSNFQTGDKISSATDVAITFAATPGTAPAADIDNVTNFKGTMLAGASINAALFDNVTNILNAGGGLGNTLTVTNGDLATVYGISGDTSAAGISVGIRTSQLVGSSDTVKLSVSGAGSSVPGATGTAPSTSLATLTSSTAGVEKITVATSGTNVFSVTGSTTNTTDGATLEITGSGSNTITASAMTQASLYDMSTSTGTNTLNLAGVLTTSDTIKGGTGADTLRVAPASTAANLTMSGVETLRLGVDSAGGTLAFTSVTDLATIRVDGDTSESGTYTLTSIGAPTALNYVGDALTSTSGSAHQYKAVTFNNAFTGSADTLAVTLSNGGVTLGASVDNTIGALSVGGVENLTLAISDVAASNTTTVTTGITSSTLKTLTVTSAGDVTLGSLAATATSGGGNLTAINLSGVTGTAAVSTLSIADDSISSATVVTANAGGMTLTIAGDEATSDSIIITGGAGVDTTVVSGGFLGTIVFDGGAGADTMVGGVGADALTGGEGGDTITGNAGADSIVLTETIAAADTVVLANIATVKSTADTVTGFTSIDNIAIQSAAGGEFADLHDSDGDSFTGAATGVVATVNIAGGAADLTPTNANVISINANTGTLATGYATIAALQTAVDGAAITEVGSGSFTNGDELLIVWFNTTASAYEVGIITIAGGNGFDGADETYESLMQVSTVGVTQAQVAASIDFLNL